MAGGPSGSGIRGGHGGCSRFCSLVLRFHVYAFTLVVTGQFLVGLYTELVLDGIQRRLAGWLLRDVINYHKVVGQALMYAGATMLAQKLWMAIKKVRPRALDRRSCWALCAASALLMQPPSSRPHLFSGLLLLVSRSRLVRPCPPVRGRSFSSRITGGA